MLPYIQLYIQLYKILDFIDMGYVPYAEHVIWIPLNSL